MTDSNYFVACWQAAAFYFLYCCISSWCRWEVCGKKSEHLFLPVMIFWS